VTAPTGTTSSSTSSSSGGAPLSGG
jgi:hypothetical protein